MLPIAGALSDRLGRVKVMSGAAVGLTAGGPVLLIMISKGNSFVAFLCQLCLGVLLSFFGGPLCAWLVENFSPEVRLTSASLGYDIAHAVAGGFSPAIATALFVNVGTAAPGLIYIVFGTVSIVGIYINYCCGGNQKEDMDPKDDLELTKGKEGAGSTSNIESDLPDIA
jgi:MHS family proline/betaine transporter-like MFS transporter